MSQYSIFSYQDSNASTLNAFDSVILDAAAVSLRFLNHGNFAVVASDDQKLITFSSLKGELIGSIYVSKEAYDLWVDLYRPLLDALIGMTDRYENIEGCFQQVQELLRNESCQVMELWEQLPQSMDYSPDICSYFFHYGWVHEELKEVLDDLLDAITKYYTEPN